MSEYGFVIDSMAEMLKRAEMAVREMADEIGNAITNWLGELFGGCLQKCGQIGIAAGKKMESIQPSATPSSGPKAERSPAIEKQPEISRNFAPSQEVQSALAGISFSFIAEDLGSVSVGDPGVGCAAQTYARYTAAAPSRGGLGL